MTTHLPLTTAILFCLHLPAQAACTLSNTTTGFGNSEGNTPLDSRPVATISLNCDNEYHLGLNAGTHFAGTRRLDDGAGHFITYHLWQDTGASQEWGDNNLPAGTYPAPSLMATGTGSEVSHSLFGTVSSREAHPPGTYTDMVHVTVTYPPYGASDKVETDLLLTLNITGTCAVETTGINSFGTWPMGTTDLTGVALGIITVTCSTGLNYTVGLDAGKHPQGRQRQMVKGTYAIPYTLWTGANSRMEWGDAGLTAIDPSYVETYPAPAVPGTGTGEAQNFFIWGDAAIQSAKVPAGNYQDDVMVTVVWP